MSLVDRARQAFSTTPPPDFEPSRHLVAAFKRARRLKRNIDRASSFNPRAHRRAARASADVRALATHEYKTFKEAHA